MNNNLRRSMDVEGAAGRAFGDQHGGFYKDESVLSLIFNPIKDYLEKTKPDYPLRIADLGCGSGLVGLYIERKLQALGYRTRLVFIDSNPKMLSAVEPNENREIVLADVSDLPEKVLQKQMDIAVGRHFIHYVPPEQQKIILEQIAKYVKKGGLFVNSTGSNESEGVVKFMSDYLSNILALRNPDSPAKRYYQSVKTYLTWMKEKCFINPRVAGQYYQPHRSFDFFERYGFNQTPNVRAEDVEKRINKILEQMRPAKEIEQVLNITKFNGHRSVNITAKIFVAAR